MKKMIPEYISEEDNKFWEKRKIKLENSADDEIDEDKKKKKKKCC